ncbi:hypothetical protein [Peribacillus kribbensis]|uniref:hypothetical protein n=1 Tax=Peribacillus kribbensis TaxID=356658 RepID=UPI0004115232|nr:hypothetical protein [Peribacillus kribbensis]
MESRSFKVSDTDLPILQSMEEIWKTTCGTWQNCNSQTVLQFLGACHEKQIDPQFCMSWIEQNSNQIPNWSEVSDTTREWINEHTSTGSPITGENDLS